MVRPRALAVLRLMTKFDNAANLLYREPNAVVRSPSAVILTDGRTLKDSVGLRVYRKEVARRLEASHDPRTYSASEMHETKGPGGEGALRGRRALGPALWDAVGLTRQLSGGESREGLWAHPRDGTPW